MYNIHIYIYIYICTYVCVCVCIYINIYIYAYVRTHTCSCAWYAQSSSCDALGRRTLATYALESAEADCLPTDADRLAYPPADAPLFALAMTVALRDAGALCDTCKSKNRCQKPRLSPRSIFWNKSRNQEEFFLIIILAFYRLQRPLTHPVPSWADFVPCHVWLMNTKFSSTLQQDTQTGRNTHRKHEDDDQCTDSTLKNPTSSPHHQVLIPSYTGVLRASGFR